jgi:NodT family efflux transporter outer membrane factor (OMF) lipoprotein
MSLHSQEPSGYSTYPEKFLGRRVLRRALIVLSGILLCCMPGCAVGPDFERPKAPTIERYTTEPAPTATIPADGKAQRFERGARIIPEWWSLFNSPKLNAVVNDAIANNQSLQAAQASLRQSQENLRAGYGIFFPQLDASADATRQKFSPARFGSSTPSSIFNVFTLSATVSYALDIFGGERRAVESLGAQVDFQRYMALGTYIALSGNVVNAVVAQAAYSDQIKATEEIINFQRDQIKITEAQAQAGLIPYANLLSLQSQVEAFESTLPPLRQKLSQTEHLLATLAGRSPAEWVPVEINMADIMLPIALPVTLPSDLVRQRPDILAAEAQLHSASAEIGVATAALFPSFTLNGSYGSQSSSTKDILKSGSGIWSLGANISQPLFHGGTLWYKRKAALEGYQQSLAIYRQTVLSAFAQVADTLRALEHDAELTQAQSKALSASEEALRLILANFQAGTATYVQVLIANGQYQQAKIGYLQSQAQRYQDTVALFVSLGGGWNLEEKGGNNIPEKTDR